VACIGGGPASLACAAELCARARAHVIERRALPGGLNTYGVAEYKLRAADSLREVEMIRRMGVEFRFGAELSPRGAGSPGKGIRFHLSGPGLGRDAAARMFPARTARA
jgi:dihydropyrimidine dehydrogenase (NAD+) subunit PreT